MTDLVDDNSNEAPNGVRIQAVGKAVVPPNSNFAGYVTRFRDPSDALRVQIRSYPDDAFELGRDIILVDCARANAYTRLLLRLDGLAERLIGYRTDITRHLGVQILLAVPTRQDIVKIDFVAIMMRKPDGAFVMVAPLEHNIKVGGEAGSLHSWVIEIESAALHRECEYLLVVQVGAGIQPVAVGRATVVIDPDFRTGRVAVPVWERQPLELGVSAFLAFGADGPSASGRSATRLTLNQDGSFELSHRIDACSGNPEYSFALALDTVPGLAECTTLEIEAMLTAMISGGRATALELTFAADQMHGLPATASSSASIRLEQKTFSQAVAAFVPRQVDARNGRLLVVRIAKMGDAEPTELRIKLRQSLANPDVVQVRRLPPPTTQVSRPAPALFDVGHYLSRLEFEAELDGFAAKDLHDFAWSHYVRHGSYCYAPNRFFDPARYMDGMAAMSDAVLGNDGADLTPLELYLVRTPRANPHPMICEAYVAQQSLALDLEDAREASALELLSTCHNFRINPHPLFRTAEVAAALGIADGSVSVLAVMDAYVRDPKAWSVATSPLFWPARLPATDIAPLLAYLVDQSMWPHSPHPLFNPAYFARQPGVPKLSLEAPLALYLQSPISAGLNPHPTFNTRYYALQSEDAWSEAMPPLEHYVRYESGDPHPSFRRRYFCAEDHARAFRKPLWPALVEAFGARPTATYAAPKAAFDRQAPFVVVQMTPDKPRNPYYRQFASGFKAAGWDFRFSNDLVAMSGYTKERRDLLFWFHQFEPFYHERDLPQTKARAKVLVETMQSMRASGARLIHTWHNAKPYDSRFIDVDFELYCQLDGLLDGIITHSESGVPWIRQFCSTVPIHVLPHPSVHGEFHTAIDRSVARRLLKIPQDRFVFLTFGEIRPYKNMPLMLDAWERLCGAGDTASSMLLIAGKWRYADQDRLRAMSLDDTIVIDRLLSDEELAMAVAASDACVFTHENVWMSGAVVTAMGFGKAMIIPDHTGLVEWLQDGESGTVFINGDVESLMNAMRRLRASKLRPHMEFINRSLVDSWHPHLLQPEYAAALKSSRKA